MIGFTTPIVIQRPATRTSRKSSIPVLDYDNATEIAVPFLVSLQPQGSTEGPVERPQVSTSWRLITPPNTDLDLRSNDRVKSGSIVLEVVGDVAKWPHPMRINAVHHVEAYLQEVRD